MSVYRDTVGRVSFSHPIGTPLTATVSQNGTPLWTSPAITPTSGQYVLDPAAGTGLPWKLTQYDTRLTVTWSDGEDFSRNQIVDVVTPLVDLDDIAAIFGDDIPPGVNELAEIEETVRTIVQSYTGQRFGLSLDTETYIGNGSGKLLLNKRLIQPVGVLGGYGMYEADWVAPDSSMNTLGQLNVDQIGILQDGWAAVFNWPKYMDVRQAPPLDLINSSAYPDGVIRVPARVLGDRDRGAHYKINGLWGYEVVPEDVRQAALLLANDYIAGDSEYRDRYLSILKIQQDSFTYHPGAFRGTGNVRADLLLGPFRRQSGMVVI